MFDGPSTVSLKWEGRGIVIDLSAVHQDPEALTVVMIAATGWLQALLAAPEGEDVPRRIQVLEEIWALLGSERVAKYFQASQKLARAYGVANISVAHRISDLRAQTDDGTAAAKVSMGLLADTQTRILFRQSSDQIPEATEPTRTDLRRGGSSCLGWRKVEPYGASVTTRRSFSTESGPRSGRYAIQMAGSRSRAMGSRGLKGVRAGTRGSRLGGSLRGALGSRTDGVWADSRDSAGRWIWLGGDGHRAHLA